MFFNLHLKNIGIKLLYRNWEKENTKSENNNLHCLLLTSSYRIPHTPPHTPTHISYRLAKLIPFYISSLVHAHHENDHISVLQSSENYSNREERRRMLIKRNSSTCTKDPGFDSSALGRGNNKKKPKTIKQMGEKTEQASNQSLDCKLYLL